MVEVVTTDEFLSWYASLNEDEFDAINRVVGLLEARGIALGFPYSSAIAGCSYALRELRAQANGHPLRVIYAFDPLRQAVLIIGGDKTGDDRFYERIIPRAESIWCAYLKEVE